MKSAIISVFVRKAIMGKYSRSGQISLQNNLEFVLETRNSLTNLKKYEMYCKKSVNYWISVNNLTKS